MKHIKQNLSLDMVEISHNVVSARENDKIVRDLDITITENGYSYPIQSGAYVYIRGKRADGKSVFYSVDIVDQDLGKIHVNIHDYLLSIPGRCTLDIGIYNRIQTNPGHDADEIASTESFILYVPNGVFDEDDVVNSDEGSALANLINSARDEILEMNALEANVTNNENIRQVKETERQANESDRKNAENDRKNAENVRKENETKRQTDTSNAIERANDAADKAEQKANDLQNKMDNHEIVFADDLQAHNTSVSAHNDVRNLISNLSTRLQTLADSDDTTLDQLSEIVAYIKNNKSLIDGITTSKVNKSGDTMSGKLNAHGGISLNESTTSSVLQYILGIDPFSQGGAVRYQNAEDVSVGSAINTDKVDGLHASSFLGNGTNFVRPNHIGGSTNANDYVKEWHGFVYNMSNLPESYGFLDVTWFDGAGFSPSPPDKGGVVRQVFTAYNTGKIYSRVRVNNSWTSWIRVLTNGSTVVSDSTFYMIDTEGRNRMVMLTYGDGSGASNYGSQLILGAGGNTFVGSGESASALYEALQTESNKKANEIYGKSGENMFISSDGHLYLYSNANQIANRKGICFSNAGILSPVGTDNISFGTLDNPFYDIFATNLRLKPKGANYGSKLIFGDSDYVHLEEFQDDQLRIKANNIYFGVPTSVPASSGSTTTVPALVKISKDGIMTFEPTAVGQPIITKIDRTSMNAVEGNFYALSCYSIAPTAIIGTSNINVDVKKGCTFLISKQFSGYDSAPHLCLTNSSYPNAKIEMKIDTEGSNITLFTNVQNKLFEIDTCADNFRIYRSKNSAITSLFEWNDTDVLLGVRMKPRSNGGCALGDSSTRFSQIWCSTSINTSSDRNLKKDIRDLSSDDRYIRFFMMLQPRSYLFKDGTSGRTHVGFISQDVEEAMTECGLTSLEFAGFCKDQKVEVITENDGTIREELVFDSEGNPVYVYSLRYEEFIALTTSVVQQQEKKIENMWDQIENMRVQILELKDKIS